MWEEKTTTFVPYSDLAMGNIVLEKEDTWDMDTALYTTYYSFSQ